MKRLEIGAFIVLIFREIWLHEKRIPENTMGRLSRSRDGYGIRTQWREKKQQSFRQCARRN